jgi:hypothetical protein
MDNSNGKGPAENSKTANTRIQWDEVTIAEHDKERGSRYLLHFICKSYITHHNDSILDFYFICLYILPVSFKKGRN